MIHVICPNCNDSFDVENIYAGKTGQCKKCKQPVAVPDRNVTYEESFKNKILPPISIPKRACPHCQQIFDVQQFDKDLTCPSCGIPFDTPLLLQQQPKQIVATVPEFQKVIITRIDLTLRNYISIIFYLCVAGFLVSILMWIPLMIFLGIQWIEFNSI